MNPLQGYKTIIIAALTVAVGIAEKSGVTLPGDFVVSTSDVLIALGGIFGALRVATKTPIGKKED